MSRALTPGPVPVTYGSTSGTAAEGNDARFPTTNEKAALAGTGTPSGSNKYVTNDDSRLSDARTPTTHAHAISDVTALQAALDAKAGTSHAHAIADVTGLQAALDGKASSTHNHSAADVTSGTLAVARGGTGLSSPGADGYVLTSDGAGGWVSEAPVPGVGGVDPALYTAKGVVLGASAADTPAAATGAVEGGFLRKTDESTSGVEWAEGFGYPARLVTSSAGPFDLTNNDAFTVKCKTGNGIETMTITVTTGDVVSIDAVTPAEIMALINTARPSTMSARVRDDGKLEIYCNDTGQSSKLRNNPYNYLRITAISASMISAMGWSVNLFGYGSGGTPASVTSGNSAPFAPAGTETLELEVEGVAVVSDVLQVTDTTAALVAARLNDSASFVAADMIAYASGNNVVLQQGSANHKSSFRVTGGTANTDLNFSTATNYGQSVLDTSIQDMQRLDEDIVGVIMQSHPIASLGTSSGAIAIDMTAGAVQNLTINDTSSFTAANIDSMGFSYTVSVFITASGADRTVSFDADWKWIGSKPSTIASGVTGLLILTNRGSADTDIVASYSVLGTG